MASHSQKWGCCQEVYEGENFLTCSKCKEMYHFACIGLDENLMTPKKSSSWKCPTCVTQIPKGKKNDNTPVRNVNTTRGNKRQAVNSPPISRRDDLLTREDVSDIVQEIIQSQFNDMLSKLNSTLNEALNTKLKPIQNEISEMIKSMEHMNEQFEEVLKEHKNTQEALETLKIENMNLKTTVSDLNIRLNQLEQHSRAKNIELQCVPEKKHENLINIVTEIGKVIKCDINEKNIINCTRVAKIQRDTNRPRSIIVELSNSRLRDEMLAGIIKYNKTNPNNRLNSSLIGIPGVKSMIYAAEHLSPANKSLHAATRIKAKQMQYKFIWVRNGRIYVRKNDESAFIWIKDTSFLDKIV